MMPDPNNDKGPFPLSKVLEEEYKALHGPLPETYPAHGPETERVAAIYALIHNLPRKRAALCLSGGGIRSATFGLGVLQGLARLMVLDKFDYLSTVSGGGYIGSWLTAWIHRHPQSVAGVAEELRRQPPATQEPEPKPVRWLRQYSNYLSPRLGLLSVDSWTLLGTYLRNLLLNWLVLAPLLIAGLMIPRLMVALVRWNLSEHGLPESLMRLALVAGLGFVITALMYLHVCRPSLKQWRTHAGWKRFETQQWFLIACLTPLLFAALLLTTAWAWFRNAGGSLDHLNLGGIGARETFVLAGALIHLAGWLFSAVLLRRLFDISRRLFIEISVILWSGALGGFFLWSVLAELPSVTPVTHFAEWHATFGVPGVLAMFLLTATIFVGVASRYTDDHDREWWGRAGAWALIAGTTWSAMAALVVFGPGLMAFMPTAIASLGGLSGVISLVLGFSSKTSATVKAKASWSGLILERAVKLAAPIFTVFLLTVLTLLTSLLLKGLEHIHGMLAIEFQAIGLRMPSDPWGHAVILHNAPLWLLVEMGFAMVALGVVMSLVININKFSLHSMYRNRLIRAYLGASRLAEYGTARSPNLFTGFDANDNVQLHKLASPDYPLKKPFHVINIAINLVKGDNLAWQQRKAQSFTASPLYCGSWNLGYRRSTRYGTNAQVEKAITLGTAMAVSGAAASPNMGYHSSSAVTFLLAFFNVRLGWWLGNPGKAGEDTFDRSCPRIAVRPLLAETFGLTDAKNPYVYLSDGGHFENLGLYEMVLRRCHRIVVSDAGCDVEIAFKDLGNAIRKIRIDLGVDIDIDLEMLRRHSDGRFSRAHYAIGAIRYDLVDANAKPGILVYLKPSLTGNEPADVAEYARRYEEFPHEPTADQFFDESQFESYHRLGEHIVHQTFRQSPPSSDQLTTQLFNDLRAGWNI